MGFERGHAWRASAAGIVAAACVQTLVSAHHSFAMYDQTKVVTLTGVVRQFVAQANHAELHFLLLTPDRRGLAKTEKGEYDSWGVEMAGAAAVAEQGITGTTFGAGTVFSVRVNPTRDGTHFGSRTGAIARCPVDPATRKPRLPEANRHCDSVPGHTLLGGQAF